EGTAALTASKVAVRRARGQGVVVFGRSSPVQVTDLTITNTGDPELTEPACRAGVCDPTGTGLLVDQAQANIADFEIVGSSFCGVYLDEEAELTLVRGSVRDNVIGVCAAADVVDLARLSNEVSYDNESNLTAVRLP